VITVHKDPACGCCSGWVEHLQKAGFATKSFGGTHQKTQRQLELAGSLSEMTFETTGLLVGDKTTL